MNWKLAKFLEHRKTGIIPKPLNNSEGDIKLLDLRTGSELMVVPDDLYLKLEEIYSSIEELSNELQYHSDLEISKINGTSRSES